MNGEDEEPEWGAVVKRNVWGTMKIEFINELHRDKLQYNI